jgi:Rad3-related DNA helicase
MNLPEWVKEIRPHQQEATDAIVHAYETGTRIFMLDAPTGSGKTLIGEMVRQSLSARALYLCSTLALQSQFASDFPDSAILRGRSNYSTFDAPDFPNLTAADCVKEKTRLPACDSCPPDIQLDDPVMHCRWCHPVSFCSYESAKRAAYLSPLVCTNLSYFLTEANYVGNITANRSLVIIDEADLIEDALLNFVTVSVSPRQQKEYNLQPPSKKTVESSWIEWATDAEAALRKLVRQRPSNDLRSIRRHHSLSRLLDNVIRLNKEDSGLASGGWVYTGYDKGNIEFKPIRVDKLATDFLWRHSERFLLMSASMISFAVLAESLGIIQ